VFALHSVREKAENGRITQELGKEHFLILFSIYQRVVLRTKLFEIHFAWVVRKANGFLYRKGQLTRDPIRFLFNKALRSVYIAKKLGQAQVLGVLGAVSILLGTLQGIELCRLLR
jgi:hypothetical protein